MKGLLSKIAAILSIIGGLAAIIALYFQWQSRQHEMGGMLNASYQSRLLNNRESKTIIVCLEDTTIDLSNIYVTPTFDNPSQYSLNDFSLTYSAESENVICKPSSFYQKHDINKQETLFKYSERFLDAHGESPRPFIGFDINDNVGRCLIKAKATYDGAPAAFEYSTDIWFIVEPNENGLSFENWKLNCKKRILDLVSENFYDVYYLKKGMPSEFQFDVALSNQISNDQYSNHKTITETDTLSSITSNQNDVKSVFEDSAISNISIDHYTIESNNDKKEVVVFTNDKIQNNETLFAFYEYNYSVYRCCKYNKINIQKGHNKFCFQLEDDVDNIEELYLCRRTPTNLVTNIEMENDSTALVTGRTNSVAVCELPYSDYSSYVFILFGDATKRISTKGSDISKLRVYISDKDHSWPLSVSLIYAYFIGTFLPIILHIVGFFFAFLFFTMIKDIYSCRIFKHSKTREGYYRLIIRLGIVMIGAGYLCWLLYFIITSCLG